MKVCYGGYESLVIVGENDMIVYQNRELDTAERAAYRSVLR